METLFDLTENPPPEGASDEEAALWLVAVYVAMCTYQANYYQFEATYVSAIQDHITDVTGLAG